MTTPPTRLVFRVVGAPGAQGSKRGFIGKHTGRVVMVEQNAAKVNAWRQDVVAAALTAARTAGWVTLTGVPVHVAVLFYLPRPAGHSGTGRNTGTLKASAPVFPITTPDVDKLTRATFDALTTAAVWHDDSQVAYAQVAKLYADATEPVGAAITVESMLGWQFLRI